jgi:hypothetical protein
VSRRRIIQSAGVIAAAVVAALVVWRSFLHDTASPVTVDAALAAFREAAAQGDTRIPAGVYVYRTTGSEFVSALGGARHRYPQETTITVTQVSCGMRLHWVALAERSSTWTVCSEGDDLRNTTWTELHRFFGRDDRTTWECTDIAWVPADAGQASISYRCVTSDTTQAGTHSVVGVEALDVSGVEVETIHVRLRLRETGAARGSYAEDRWLERATGLPIRMTYKVRTANASPIGDVTFEETYDLSLASLEPRK